MEEQVEQVKQVEQKMNEKPSKYTGGGRHLRAGCKHQCPTRALELL